MFCADYKSTNVIIAERSLTLDGVDDQSNNIKLNLHINEVILPKYICSHLVKMFIGQFFTQFICSVMIRNSLSSQLQEIIKQRNHHIEFFKSKIKTSSRSTFKIISCKDFKYPKLFSKRL
jgi:ATP-dependent protease Clp ATPase subunit